MDKNVQYILEVANVEGLRKQRIIFILHLLR